MSTLRKKSAAELSKLMKLSDKLAELNADRNQAWQATHDSENSKQAIYAFQGDVYQGLAVEELSSPQVKRCQKHVRILSGLYGMLRPLDLMQPYRLEMGTKLRTDAGKDLYAFWDDTIRNAITAELKKLKSSLIVNLASNEYAKVAQLPKLDAEVISPAFKEWKNGEYKMISFFAKRARGTMTRYLIQNSVKNADGINGFDLDGYEYNESLSKENTPVFTRKQS